MMSGFGTVHHSSFLSVSQATLSSHSTESSQVGYQNIFPWPFFFAPPSEIGLAPSGNYSPALGGASSYIIGNNYELQAYSK